MLNLNDAKSYISTYVLLSDAWDSVDDATKQKALNQAERQLYSYYKRFKESENPLPLEAICEQALWILRMDDVILRSDAGVSHTQVSSIGVSVSKVDRRIAPEVINLLGRKVGSYHNINGFLVKGSYRK
jgi:hypothetical protein